ncbi:restriction endonuclease [Kingella potus]|uniref:restriction endonuclease n=1 Tax=Kingella potus TaxID=265175 RepID=UPI001FD1B7D6|nr:restriction endonuclease [Kingella potus]UOP00280.1 restriction endonuclease [Kingella potus]
MPIPSFEELRLPILKLLASGETRRKAQLIEPLAAHFGLDTDDIAQEYESGNGAVFADRISWALSYLALSGLLSRPKRGHYVITGLGREYAQKDAAEVIAYVKQKMTERERGQKADGKETVATAEVADTTPTEQLEASFGAIRQKIYDEILNTILSKTPQAFEKLVVDLLQKMGYGGRLEKSAQVTRASRDGGIDGEIREDVLGLGRIFIQAKRYQTDAVIYCPDIQGFVGALQGQNADKGIFITTARYSY